MRVEPLGSRARCEARPASSESATSLRMRLAGGESGDSALGIAIRGPRHAFAYALCVQVVFSYADDVVAMGLNLPETDARIAGRSSVALVICQVRFDEQTSITASTALAFHERLGGEEGPYSKIAPFAGAGRIVLEVGPSGPVPQPARQTGWILGPDDGSWSLTLLPDSMGLQVNEGSGAYNGWDDFRGRLSEALAALQEVASPALEHRLGFRIADRIPGTPIGVEDAIGWSEYISTSFLGPIVEPAIAEAVKFSQQQLILDIGDRTICTVRQGLAAVLSLGEANTEYVIDADVYREVGRSFDSATIIDSAEAFKQTIDGLFGTIATSALVDKVAP